MGTLFWYKKAKELCTSKAEIQDGAAHHLGFQLLPCSSPEVLG